MSRPVFILSNDGTIDNIVKYVYDNNGRLTEKKNSCLSGEERYSLSYYLNGNIETISEPEKTTSFIYDNLGRLTKESVSNEGETNYSYDRFSNRASKILKDANGEVISQTEYTYSKNNQLLSEINDNYLKTNLYDNNGNLVSKIYNTLTDNAETGERVKLSNIPLETPEKYSYDAFNRLIKYEKGENLATYVYNGNNLRQSKTVNGIETKHIYDGQNIIKDGENTFIRGIGLISANLNGVKTYYSFNAHNDTAKLVNSEGIVTKDYTYDAFGNEKEQAEEDINPFRYCGEYFDNESGFIYLRARYYDSAIGRFISEDPAKDGLNWYVYANNNPIMFVDPLGLEYIAVSGGRYDDTTKTGYEFIETAIKKLREWKALDNGENIAWLVANAGWSQSDIDKFQAVADDIGVTLKMLNSTDDFVNYINKKSGHDRYKDKITKFAVFSHGKDTNGGTIELAYYHDNPSKLQISKDTITNRLWATAFESPNTYLGACNLANGNNDFANTWQKKFGGTTWGFQGKSDYADIWVGQSLAIKISRKLHGFSYFGSANYPIASSAYKLPDGRISEVVNYD